MNERPKSLTDVKDAVEEFTQLVAADYRSEFSISSPYIFQDGPGKHWPTNYGDVWENYARSGPTIGVYLFFAANDVLIYVGKAVSIGDRLGAYLQRDKPDRNACKVIDKDIHNHGGKSVRAIILNRPRDGSSNNCRFLTPALELYLISKLNPPINKLHRTSEWRELPDSPVDE